nr:ATP-dependent Clp protease proteolytic subunit [Mycobacterium sp. E3298]
MNPDRVLYIYDLINNQSVAPVMAEIIRINNEDDFNQVEDREPIHLIINSGGGNILDAITMASLMETSKTPIYTYCYGYAYSAAFLIFACGHKRYAGLFAEFMFHDPSENIGGSLQLHDLRQRVEKIEKLVTKRNSIISSKTNLSVAFIHSKRNEDYYMDIDEAIKWGIVDEQIA